MVLITLMDIDDSVNLPEKRTREILTLVFLCDTQRGSIFSPESSAASFSRCLQEEVGRGEVFPKSSWVEHMVSQISLLFLRAGR